MSILQTGTGLAGGVYVENGAASSANPQPSIQYPAAMRPIDRPSTLLPNWGGDIGAYLNKKRSLYKNENR